MQGRVSKSQRPKNSKRPTSARYSLVGLLCYRVLLGLLVAADISYPLPAHNQDPQNQSQRQRTQANQLIRSPNTIIWPQSQVHPDNMLHTVMYQQPSEPVNPPPGMTQELASQLEKYYQNQPSRNSEPNLASINHRVVGPYAAPKTMTLPSKNSPSTSIHTESVQQQSKDKVFLTPISSTNKQGTTMQLAERADRRQDQNPLTVARDPLDGHLTARKGKLDDLSKHNFIQLNKINPYKPVSSALIKSKPSLNFMTHNCISRSTYQASICEDHLVKRLNQDAVQGRTAIDVGRRICCALFWHKDCISKVVLETCPDSSPQAAEYIMGTGKNFDLAVSCKMFTREGCNGSPSGLSIGFSQIGLTIVISILTVRCLVRDRLYINLFLVL